MGMNKVEAVRKLNETELKLGIAGSNASWHQTYSSYDAVYVGGFPTAYTEGDLVAMFEQFGVVIHVHLVREAESGRSRGFAFLKYHDPRSAVLAVDNFNGVTIAGRMLAVDHAADYNVPEEGEGKAIDTTPVDMKAVNSTGAVNVGVVAGCPQDSGTPIVEKKTILTAEERREKAVLERLAAMHKLKRLTEGSERTSRFESVLKRPQVTREKDREHNENQSHSDSKGADNLVAVKLDNESSHAGKRRRKRERQDRKAERNKVRDERIQRRLQREKKA